MAQVEELQQSAESQKEQELEKMEAMLEGARRQEQAAFVELLSKT